VMSTDPARVAQIEQHARDVALQPSTMQFEEGSDTAPSADAKPAHPKAAHPHHKKKKAPVSPM
jgi:hypothetical protein